jgi:diaminopropionate ammonia-lyase
VRRLAAATDGNHGRAVARLAAQLGLAATIHVPATMVPARRAAIAGEGAELVVDAGGYDSAVRAATAAAEDPACRVIADADHDGSSPVPGWVIEGYATLFGEIAGELTRRDVRADLVVLQIGVGAFAAAGVRWAANAGVAAVGVEPVGAPCVAASLAAGHPVEVETPGTVMAGLDAALPSVAAWPVLEAALAGVVVVEDVEAEAAVALLAEDGLAVGESGAAGVAGLVALAHDARAAPLRARLGWRRGATVVAVATEGPTAA